MWFNFFNCICYSVASVFMFWFFVQDVWDLGSPDQECNLHASIGREALATEPPGSARCFLRVSCQIWLDTIVTLPWYLSSAHWPYRAALSLLWLLPGSPRLNCVPASRWLQESLRGPRISPHVQLHLSGPECMCLGPLPLPLPGLQSLVLLWSGCFGGPYSTFTTSLWIKSFCVVFCFWSFLMSCFFFSCQK